MHEIARTTNRVPGIPNSLAKRFLPFLLAGLIAAMSAVLAPSSAWADETPSISAPTHVLGLDISRYQHSPNSKPSKANSIDFTTMYGAGVRFVYINGGNTIAKADALAAGYYNKDRPAAQAAGIFTGFYYYAHMPNSRASSIVIRNAHNQASKVIARVAAQGGLNSLDLPIALDLETSCVRQTAFGICLRKMNKTLMTQWATTWLADIKHATGRTPLIYSYLSFLTTEIGDNSTIAQSPLWISTAGINPATPGATPASKKRKGGACYKSAWMDSACNLNWTIWQYSSGGIGKSYGLAGGKVDQDIFMGDDSAFAAFAAG